MVEFWGNTAMYGEVLTIYDGTQGHGLKKIHYCLIDLAIIFLLAYINFILHYNLKLKKVVMVRLSWFPRSKKMLFG